MKAAIGGIVIFLAACSGSEGSEPEACDLAHREGTYLRTYVEHSMGTCGALRSDLVVIKGGFLGIPDGCALDEPSRASADGCEITTAFTCPFEDDGTATTSSFILTIRESDGGAWITGALQARFHDDAGALVCASLYDVEYERQ
jgi:hypothetical protein